MFYHIFSYVDALIRQCFAIADLCPLYFYNLCISSDDCSILVALLCEQDYVIIAVVSEPRRAIRRELMECAIFVFL